MLGRTSLALALILSLCLPGCDKLGGSSSSSKKSEAKSSESDESESSDESSSKSKKKKKKKKADEESEEEASAKPTAAPAPTPSATETAPAPSAAPSAETMSGDAKRYPQQEVADTGKLAISNPVPARKEADNRSETVLVLQPGNEVNRVARMGPYELVSWTNKSGDKFGWIEIAKAVKPGTVLPQPSAHVPAPEFDDVRFPKDGGTTAPKTDAGTTTPKVDAGTTAPKVDAGKVKTDAF
ncbi:MAG TPA: hypothetical protein VL400_01290 [Polyangiaceae bacterium]|nr:hypothetical protein [Polyangiaceae bacterium]